MSPGITKGPAPSEWQATAVPPAISSAMAVSRTPSRNAAQNVMGNSAYGSDCAFIDGASRPPNTTTETTTLIACSASASGRRSPRTRDAEPAMTVSSTGTSSRMPTASPSDVTWTRSSRSGIGIVPRHASATSDQAALHSGDTVAPTRISASTSRTRASATSNANTRVRSQPDSATWAVVTVAATAPNSAPSPSRSEHRNAPSATPGRIAVPRSRYAARPTAGGDPDDRRVAGRAQPVLCGLRRGEVRDGDRQDRQQLRGEGAVANHGRHPSSKRPLLHHGQTRSAAGGPT